MAAGVSLQGSFNTVPAHDLRSGLPALGSDGSVLVIHAHQGNASGTPFLTAGPDGTIAGMVLYHGDQVMTGAPLAYPWAISLDGAVNSAVKDVELLNAWNGITGSLVPPRMSARAPSLSTHSQSPHVEPASCPAHSISGPHTVSFIFTYSPTHPPFHSLSLPPVFPSSRLPVFPSRGSPPTLDPAGAGAASEHGRIRG